MSLQGYAAKSEQQAPNFSITHLLDGKQASLNQYQGKVVYLDFWASWCPPCLKSFPFMEDLQVQYGKEGLVVLAVNLDENIEDAKAFLKEAQASFFVGHNDQTDIATLYGVEAMPSSFLIGRDGSIQIVHRGFKTSDQEKLKKIIAEQL
jgi:thiol-disulfide isomerase/thioredoxin